MKKRLIAASAAVLITFAGCANGKTEENPAPLPEKTESENVEASDTGDADTLAACRILAAEEDSVLWTFPELLSEMPGQIDDSNVGPYLSAYWAFEGAREKAPAEMAPYIEKLNAPFEAIYEVTQGTGSGDISADTSEVMETVTEILNQCNEAGFQVDN